MVMIGGDFGGGAGWAGMGMGGGRRGRQSEEERKRLQKTKINWYLVGQAFKLARPFYFALAVFTACSFVSSAVRALPPIMMKFLIDVAIMERGSVAWLTFFSLAAIGLNLTGGLIMLLQRYQSAKISSGMSYNLRSMVYEHVHNLPIDFYTRSRAGAVMQRINNDVTGANQIINEIITTFSVDATGLFAAYAAMLWLDWRITLVVTLAIPGFLIPQHFYAPFMQRVTRERMNLNAALNTWLQERVNVSGALLSKLFGEPKREIADFQTHAVALRNIAVKVAVVTGLYTMGMSLYASVATSIVYWYGGWLVITTGGIDPNAVGAVTIGTVVAFGSYSQRAHQPIQQLARARVNLITALVTLERLFEILDFENRIKNSEGAVDLLEPQGHVKFDNVSFRYPSPAESTVPTLENPMAMIDDPNSALDDREPPQVLHNLSFEALPGEQVALVGPTGAGKTTTLSLIPRLYDATEGTIYIDGHDVRDLTLESLRAAIGFVSQDPHLFHDSIRANLLFARPDATEDDMIKACKVARIHDLIDSLPDGYDTIAGDRGYRLSGGEKQRLSIARMVLKNPSIVILDEATSHLDSENEVLIQAALEESLRGRTTLAIAHRLSTIISSDRIVVLQKGGAIEQGTHEELLENEHGLYRKLYDTQFGKALVGAPSEENGDRSEMLERRARMRQMRREGMGGPGGPGGFGGNFPEGIPDEIRERIMQARGGGGSGRGGAGGGADGGFGWPGRRPTDGRGEAQGEARQGDGEESSDTESGQQGQEKQQPQRDVKPEDFS